MSQNYPSIINAVGSMQAAGPSLWEAGCLGARTGAGVYTVTLDEPSDSAACAILVTMRTGGIPCVAQVVHTSDTVKTINVFDSATGGVATDSAFDFLVLRAPLS
jgi:hypothetical protein